MVIVLSSACRRSLGLMTLLVATLVAHSALAQSPFGPSLSVEQTLPMQADGWLGGLFQWLLVKQQQMQALLTQLAQALSDDPAALGAFLLACFTYGALHAVGPGHGKVVVSTYMLASDEEARMGGLLALLAAFVQAGVAIAMIGVMTLVLSATARQINAVADGLEVAGLAFVCLIGLWLIWRGLKLLLAFKYSTGTANHQHHAHDHAHGHSHSHFHSHNHAHDGHHHDHDGEACDCGHVHAPDLDAIRGGEGWRSRIGVILSMGLRPCTGALLVLVLTASQGVFWAGALGALAMGLGTGLAVAIFAIAARGLRHLMNSGANRASTRVLSVFTGFLMIVSGVLLSLMGSTFIFGVLNAV